MNNNPILEAINVSKVFDGAVTNKALDNISFSIDKGELVAVTGKSGCGKSTLLYILSTMDTDYTGDLIIDNESMLGKTEAELARIRNEKIGFVFQFHYLIKEFNVLQNIMLPALKRNRLAEEQIRANAMTRLQMLNIANLAHKPVSKLSGGEKQRVAIARALINDPLIIMADEPTGNLDSKNAENVLSLFREMADKHGQTLLIVTHDRGFAERADRIIEMEDGRLLAQPTYP
jgi:lipoprotein-releasing system ATP-binding protein